MITLCGFAVSNYYNKVKLALLEKGVPFTEEHHKTGGTDEAYLAATPLAKVPFMRTEHGTMCESQVMLDYIEAVHPTPPLLPADPWQAAKVRELITFIDLHLELVARELYSKAFFGGGLSDENATRLRAKLTRNIAGFKRLAKFSPYVAGDTFTMADCAAWPRRLSGFGSGPRWACKRAQARRKAQRYRVVSRAFATTHAPFCRPNPEGRGDLRRHPSLPTRCVARPHASSTPRLAPQLTPARARPKARQPPSLPLVSMATRAVYGEDLMATAGIDTRAYARLIGGRPAAQKVSADRKAEQATL